MAAVIDDIIWLEEDPVGQPVVAHVLPDILDRIQLGAFGRNPLRESVRGAFGISTFDSEHFYLTA